MNNDLPASRKWALFRFSVIGNLFSSPPLQGDLQQELEELSKRTWSHPTSGDVCQFSKSTIERWYYRAKKVKDSPVAVLARKIRSDINSQKALTAKMINKLQVEVEQHKTWSLKLHSDNLGSIIRRDDLGNIPSYPTVRRYLKSIGYQKISSKNQRRKGYHIAKAKKEPLETRSFENAYVGGLFHLDFHNCSRDVITSSGEIVYPRLFGAIDDCSRLICHAQWYLSESAENIVHGFIQALQKRGLPRKLLSDNGKAMKSAEFTSGLATLGIQHDLTLPYHPNQNGKQEVFWGQIEGRLMKLLENKKILTLQELNDATQAWIEMEYNRKFHSEIKTTPLERYLNHRGVLQSCPNSDKLRQAFRREEVRMVRRSDGSIPVEGVRFEIPSQYRHLAKVTIQYHKWDLANIGLIDRNSGNQLCLLYPVDKIKNSSGIRKSIAPVDKTKSIFPKDEVAPLMEELLAQYAATGLPYAYQPKEQDGADNE